MRERNQKQAAQNTIDQTPRFEQGAVAEISTDMGWVRATVQDILQSPVGILYNVRYIPMWETTGTSYATVATGAAIRHLLSL